MSYKTGKSKPLEEITLEDVLENKIWEWAFDEESEENQDETWQRPILDCENVTDEIFNLHIINYMYSSTIISY